jgi:hypothetical protein
MSDIVERLELEVAAWKQASDLKAVEIERLHGEIKSVHAHLAHYRTLVDGLRAEIERLTTQNTEAAAKLRDET